MHAECLIHVHFLSEKYSFKHTLVLLHCIESGWQLLIESDFEREDSEVSGSFESLSEVPSEQSIIRHHTPQGKNPGKKGEKFKGVKINRLGTFILC